MTNWSIPSTRRRHGGLAVALLSVSSACSNSSSEPSDADGGGGINTQTGTGTETETGTSTETTTGGAGATGGAPTTGGGPTTTGGNATISGGTGGATTGGSRTGGQATTGGSAAGGQATGGSAMGGQAITGGSTTGGQATGGSEGGGNGSGGGGSGSGGVEGPWPPSATYQNPILWEDLADPEVIRVGDVYYYTGSNMHYSPGAPILRSWDLVNWEYAGHAVPVLDFDRKYDLDGGRAYIRGDWASAFAFRESNETFYWLGCFDFSQSYVFTAAQVEGPWEEHGPLPCYYDAGFLIDDDDTMYVAYGNTQISVAELSADGFSEVRSQKMFDTPTPPETLEGSRFYKHDGYYYIFLTRPANAQWIARATDPFGPYELHEIFTDIRAPVQGAGVPHQGALFETAAGDWYYMAFVDAYPGGRIPVLAPISWENDWPVVDLPGGAWAQEYPFPDVPRPPRLTASTLGRFSFDGPELGQEWEWNHNPDNRRWSLGPDGITLQTATVTDDLYDARNTLTHRIHGPEADGTIELDYSNMADGDVAGFVMLKHVSAWIGVKQSGGQTRVVMVNDVNMDTSWVTTSTGTEIASEPISGGKIWLRIHADIHPGNGRTATFHYSTDGETFSQFGNSLTLSNDWQFFMGYRFGIFNYATSALGGSITVPWFEINVNG